MGKQFNIRSERAHALATGLSARLGKPLNVVVEDALAEYDLNHPSRAVDLDELWGPVLRKTQAAFRASKIKFDIEDLYDPETGLPA